MHHLGQCVGGEGLVFEVASDDCVDAVAEHLVRLRREQGALPLVRCRATVLLLRYGCRLPSYQLCSPGQQHAQVARFDHVVVGPRLVAFYLVLLVVERREHDHRQAAGGGVAF